MHRIAVRRRQANEGLSVREFVIQADTTMKLERQLREFLSISQHERGSGVWSDADPEVWIEGSFVGRLSPEGDVERLAREALVQLVAGSVGLRARRIGAG
jgi:hypothetical protein